MARLIGAGDFTGWRSLVDYPPPLGRSFLVLYNKDYHVAYMLTQGTVYIEALGAFDASDPHILWRWIPRCTTAQENLSIK